MLNSSLQCATPSKRIHNFCAGPAALPSPVLRHAQVELLNFGSGSDDLDECGVSILEMSHRSSTFNSIITKTENDLRHLVQIPDNYKVLFMQGGGTGQFSAVPLNLVTATQETKACYVVTGAWSKKAADEAIKLLGKENVHILCSGEKYNFTHIPEKSEWSLLKHHQIKPAYIFYCANETIHGLEFPDELLADTELFPADVPVVVDMSSNFLTRPVDVCHYGVIVAAAQKNYGPAGLAIVLIRQDLIPSHPCQIPLCLDYKLHADTKSLHNTPPTFAIYIAGLVFDWLRITIGGLEKMQELNNVKSTKLYTMIDTSNGFYRGCVSEPKQRSLVNVVFRVGNGDVALESLFVSEAAKRGLVQLQGHRSVQGIRASLYNAVSLEAVDALIDFMKDFQKAHE